MIRDRYGRESAASMLGYVTMGFAMAPMVGPVIGGVLNDTFGWRSIFALQTGLGAAVAIACVLFLPETNPLAERRAEARPGWRHSFSTLGRIPAFWAYALTCAFGTSVFFAFLGGTPFVAVDMLGMTGTEYGLYFVLVPGGFLIGNFLTARYARRTGLYRHAPRRQRWSPSSRSSAWRRPSCSAGTIRWRCSSRCMPSASPTA